MLVQTSQLKEGYILLRAVQGKSGRPIMKEKTVLTKEHITILQKFLVHSVEVSAENTNSNQLPAQQQPDIKERQHPALHKESPKEEVKSFDTHYLEAVAAFKKAYEGWNSGVPIDISKVRNIIIPLLERIDEIDFEAFTLYDHVVKEEYIYHHSVAVSVLAAFLGKESGFSKGEWLQIGLAGILSDAGMTRVDENILSKGGPLTENQLQDIHNHPVYSSRMIENLPAITQGVKSAVLQHHERNDGSGYPAGLSRENIHPYAKILAVSDTYHAMVSERLYKKKIPILKAVEELQKLRYSTLDTQVIQLFIKTVSLRSLGKTVRLSDGTIGEIVFIDENNPAKPLIKSDLTKEVISLQENSKVYIEEFLNGRNYEN